MDFILFLYTSLQPSQDTWKIIVLEMIKIQEKLLFRLYVKLSEIKFYRESCNN